MKIEGHLTRIVVSRSDIRSEDDLAEASRKLQALKCLVLRLATLAQDIRLVAANGLP